MYTQRGWKYLPFTAALLLYATGALADGSRDVDQQFRALLEQFGFTGNVESTLAARLGRPVNPKLADLGRLLFFDVAGGLHDDNTCGGCHSPSSGFGTLNRLPSVSRTTVLLVLTDPVREISAVRPQ